MRQPYAMRTLIAQVVQRHEDAAFEVADVDGLGVARTLVVGDATSEKLLPAVEYLVHDDRIAGIENQGGVLHISFVIDSRADRPNPFFLPVTGAAGDGQTDDTEAVQAAVDADPREARRKVLQDTPVDELREDFGFTKEQKKPEIINTILADEFGG